MAASSDVRHATPDRVGARCWALVLAVLASITLPLVYVVPDADERGEPATLWNAVTQVVFAEGSDFGDGDRIGFAVSVARLALALLFPLLAGALGVAAVWAEVAAVDDVSRWVRRVLGGVILLDVVALLLAAGQVGDSDVSGIKQGLDVGAGLWAPLVVALVLLAPADA